MTNREKLQENYEDSALALLMDDFAELEGARYIEENERLLRDPAAAVPEDVEKRALQLIRRELSGRKRTRSDGRLLRNLGRFAIAALVAVLLFGAAFALSGTVRAGTLNFLMRMDAKIATWQFEEDEDGSSDVRAVLFVEWLPDGFRQGMSIFSGPSDILVDCTNDVGELIRVSVHESEDFMHTLDLEAADYYKEITVQGCDGILIVKDGIVRVDWPYRNSDMVVIVESTDADEDILLRVAESVQLIG